MKINKKIVISAITILTTVSMTVPSIAASLIMKENSEIESDYQTLKNALNEAQYEYENAVNEKEEARIAFEEQENKTNSALDSVRNLAGDELATAVEDLKVKVEEVKNNYSSAVTQYNESLDALNGGAFSFFRWVANNYPGYADDANNAIAVLEKAQSLGYVTDAGYSEDQTSFYAMKVAERYMENYVTLRAYLGMQYVPMTNLTAIADSMMAVGGARSLMYHYVDWLYARGWDENLAFGYGVFGDYGNIYNGELAEVLGYALEGSIGEVQINYAEMSGDIELIEEIEVIPETTTQSDIEDIIESAEETITIEPSEEATEAISKIPPMSETEDTTETSAATIESAEEQSSEPESITEEIAEEETTEETEENLLEATSEEESTTEVAYPTFEEWYAQEVNNGMLAACPFLAMTYTSPFSGWYTEEKYSYDLRKNYNYDDGGEVGHYYNLIRNRNSEIFAMAKTGTVYVIDMRSYYTGNPSTALTSGLGFCTNYAAMSVYEYNSLLDAFYNSLNLKTQKDTLERYKTEYQSNAVKLAYCKAKKTYEDACTVFNNAKAVLEDAQSALSAVSGWSQENDTWYFYKENGDKATGWLYRGTENGKEIWYYFNTSGAMQTGWANINNKWYYFNESGRMTTGWLYRGTENGKEIWYYFNASGAMQIGWASINNKWYYFNESGRMTTGWLYRGTENGKEIWYYFSASGAMQTGWANINNKWYYFNESGRMAIGWLYRGTESGNEIWYYFNASGAMQTGWVKINNKWYYMEPSSGRMVTGTITINGTSYTMNSSGVWVK